MLLRQPGLKVGYQAHARFRNCVSPFRPWSMNPLGGEDSSLDKRSSHIHVHPPRRWCEVGPDRPTGTQRASLTGRLKQPEEEGLEE